MSTTTVAPSVPRSRRRILSSIGLTVAAVMSVFNTINGAGSLIDPTFGQTDPTLAAQPVWMSLLLLAFGLSTLAAAIPAWRGHRGALWVVIATRILESWSALMLRFLPGAPEGMWGFVVALIVVGTVVAALVAQGLRR